MNTRFRRWALILGGATALFVGSHVCSRLSAQAPPPPLPSDASAQPAQPGGADQAPAGDRTPDECWKWGLFYYNPADPDVWVEKRIGIGWTFNFGHPRAWFILGAILLFAAAVPVLSVLLFK